MNATLVACTFIENQGKYLLVKQAKGRRQPGKWGPPGGKPEHEQGETLFEAAVRETAEETGLEVVLTDLVGLARSGHPTGPNLFICFAARLKEGYSVADLKLKEDEIAGIGWYSLEEIEQQVIPLRCEALVALYQRHRLGQLYPLGLIQHESINAG